MDAVTLPYLAVLKGYHWKEGATIHLEPGCYRSRVVITCSILGRQMARFANGEYPYFASMDLTRSDGSWIREGAGVVPVLPNGDLLMVIEQRPAHFRLSDQPMSIVLSGEVVDLTQYGPFSSVEFPGGAIDSGDGTAQIGALREMNEETGVLAGQCVNIWECTRPYFAQGSDLALQSYRMVVELSSGQFQGFVQTDGGLHVLAISPADILVNIRMGNIRSAQAMLIQWYFYQEVVDATMRHKIEELTRGDDPYVIYHQGVILNGS